MTRKYTNILSEALENGTISYETVVNSFLTFLSEDQVQEFVESEFTDLIEEDEEDDEDKSLSFNTQEEHDDYSASNPPSRSYCLECGDDYEWFMHNCNASAFNEAYGCSKCDDHCAFCND